MLRSSPMRKLALCALAAAAAACADSVTVDTRVSASLNGADELRPPDREVVFGPIEVLLLPPDSNLARPVEATAGEWFTIHDGGGAFTLADLAARDTLLSSSALPAGRIDQVRVQLDQPPMRLQAKPGAPLGATEGERVDIMITLTGLSGEDGGWNPEGARVYGEVRPQ